MSKNRYVVRLQHYKKGPNGTTRYAFSTRLKAVIFGAGYQAALHDIGRPDLYVSVWKAGVIDSKTGFHNWEQLFDSDALLDVARREC